ncbi:hypothetical protein [Shinella granuli]|uniref:hypothetical protein n=1 Tax=Shinella granuli TaxID=323621 RepID=UPI0031EB19CB
MKAPPFSMMPRADFSALSLHEKNTYLQTLADQYADQHERERVWLDKDGLSRLRRYYSRRVWADLKLDSLSDSRTDMLLARLGEAIRNESIKADVTAPSCRRPRPSASFARRRRTTPS